MAGQAYGRDPAKPFPPTSNSPAAIAQNNTVVLLPNQTDPRVTYV